MKCELQEFEGCFNIAIEAETKEEVVQIARFGIGKTKEIQSVGAYFSERGTATLSVTVGKKKSGSGTL